MYKTHIYANFYGFVKFWVGMWWKGGGGVMVMMYEYGRSKMEIDLGQACVFLDSKESEH